MAQNGSPDSFQTATPCTSVGAISAPTDSPAGRRLYPLGVKGCPAGRAFAVGSACRLVRSPVSRAQWNGGTDAENRGLEENDRLSPQHVRSACSMAISTSWSLRLR